MCPVAHHHRTHTRFGIHHLALRQRHTDLVRAKRCKERSLASQVRARRIPERIPLARIARAEQVLLRQARSNSGLTGTVRGAVSTPVDAKIRSLAGVWLSPIDSGLCRFVFTGWDDANLAFFLGIADLDCGSPATAIHQRVNQVPCP